MAQRIIGMLGFGGEGTDRPADSQRLMASKINANFAELYAMMGALPSNVGNVDFGGIASSFAAINSRLDDDANSLAQHQAALNSMQVAMDAVTQEIAAHEADFHGTQSQVDSVTSALADLQAAMAATQDNLTAYQAATTSQYDGVTASMSAVTSDVTALKTSDAQEQADIASLKTRAGTLEGQIPPLSASISANTAAIAALSSQIAAPQNTANGAASAVASLQAEVNSEKAKTASNTSSIATLVTNTGNNATAIATANTTITAQGAQITTANTNISNLTATVTTQGGTLSTHTSQIVALTTTNTTQDGLIATANTNIGTLTNNLAAEVTARIAGDVVNAPKMLTAQTTSASTVRLTTDGLAAGAGNVYPLPNQTARTARILVSARQTGGTAGTVGDSAMFEIDVMVTRGATAANTAVPNVMSTNIVLGLLSLVLGGANISPMFSTGLGGGWRMAATADTANGALALTATGEANKTIRWVARMDVVDAS